MNSGLWPGPLLADLNINLYSPSDSGGGRERQTESDRQTETERVRQTDRQTERNSVAVLRWDEFLLQNKQAKNPGRYIWDPE